MSKKDMLKNQLLKKSVKKELPDTQQIEEITEKVYNKPAPTLKKKEAAKEPVQRTTLDIPKSLHIKAKVEAMQEGISLREFILTLIKAELKKRGSL